MDKNVRLNLLNEDETVSAREWRKALRSHPTYRIVNKTIRGQTQFISVVGFTGLCVLIVLYMYPRRGSFGLRSPAISTYNYTYPLTRPIRTSSLHSFRIGIIADLDTNSKSDQEKNQWHSFLKTGYLSYNPANHAVVVTWDRSDVRQLKNSYALKGRGMELSELVVFDGRLLTFDDRTGIIFEIVNEVQMIPWVLLTDGNGKSAKGFKSEWATVKNELLYIGSMGKEWTTASGEFESHDPQYIKIVTTQGQVTHVNWVKEYNRLRESLGIYWPGYMIHESGVWSDVHKRWFFLPRRCSKEQYNESLDERRGCNVLLSADTNMYDVKVVQLVNSVNTRGFSSFKFVPTSNDYVIVALKTEEVNGTTATYITAFTIDGEILLDDSYISDLKYEGIEFI
ncbi:soluble calcium-activated nucleotidase 1 [Cylas formicarius]|uniref:soluble calcium-activated nucleotidase 1 n=1 Tax=Cylas formicarius TaxID=197179 RepID=UPI002958C76A|nr:soluble calcium-activated nucleotidase 1 [Cylas formicarius]